MVVGRGVGGHCLICRVHGGGAAGLMNNSVHVTRDTLHQ